MRVCVCVVGAAMSLGSDHMSVKVCKAWACVCLRVPWVHAVCLEGCVCIVVGVICYLGL